MTNNNTINNFDHYLEGLLLNLIEEANEVALIATKALRFGLDSYDPNDPKQKTNRMLIARELGNLLHIQNLLLTEDVLDSNEIDTGIDQKRERLNIYPMIVKNK